MSCCYYLGRRANKRVKRTVRLACHPDWRTHTDKPASLQSFPFESGTLAHTHTQPSAPRRGSERRVLVSTELKRRLSARAHACRVRTHTLQNVRNLLTTIASHRIASRQTHSRPIRTDKHEDRRAFRRPPCERLPPNTCRPSAQNGSV